MNIRAEINCQPIDSHDKPSGKAKWTIKEKVLLGLTPRQYMGQAVRNPLNWLLGAIFAVGVPVIVYRFLFGLGSVTHASNDYPWGLFLGFGLFCMVPLSASGFLLGTTVELFGRHDFKPILRLALLNGLLGYLFAVVYLLNDLGMPWRLYYPMFVAWGTAAVLFLVGWHVATYLTVQVMEISESFFEWAKWPNARKFIKSITIGLTVSGIILSTLHQGALGALFSYAPGKIHPLWFSAPYKWILYFISSIAAGLAMTIVVSTLVKKTMAWRCSSEFLDNLDRITVALGKGSAMALLTYLAVSLISIAHDNKWAYLATGWGGWYLLEMAILVAIPLTLFCRAVLTSNPTTARWAAFITVAGVLLNRLNTALVAFNWKLYRELPALGESIIVITVFALYIVVYRAILYRLPILYEWKAAVPVLAEAPEAARAGISIESSSPAPARS
jgi:Ni/Fe-hydrogenase subunit HybB-like protein